jgi:hypothetical protein
LHRFHIPLSAFVEIVEWRYSELDTGLRFFIVSLSIGDPARLHESLS